MSVPGISVVVPCYGRPDFTRALLDSLATCEGDFQVVLVDDASPSPVDAVADAYADQLDLEVVRHQSQRGPAAARNTGVRAARHDLIAFTDNDCVVTPSWPRALATYLRDAPQKVAGVGGRTLAVDGDVFSRYFTYHKILDPFPFEGRYLYVVTANCAFRRAALEEVGGFDERIRAPGGEDPGLCFKLLQAGWELHYWKDAIVHHRYRMGLLDFARTFYLYGRGCRLQTDAYGAGLATGAVRALGFGGGTPASR